MPEYDSIIIGSGPNGLAAAVALAREDQRVLLIEQHDEIGGGTRTADLTLPGFRHDVCSAIHPMGVMSPFFQSLPLADFGLEFIHPDIPLAHPFDDGSAVAMHQSVAETAAQFSPGDAKNYHRLFDSITRDAEKIFTDALAPPRIPRHPFAIQNFGLRAIPSALAACRAWFSDEKARALIAGNGAHSVLPLDRPLSTNAIGIMLMLACHSAGWPLARGGSQSIANSLGAYLESLGGKIETGRIVQSLDDLPTANAYIFDTAPSALVRIAGDQLPDGYTKRLRKFRHGPGIFKIDYALSEPVPWKSEACRRAGTVHLGATLDEITASERDCWEGFHSEKPFVLSAQQSLFDDTRAPAGKHTYWAYCHVPHGSTVDMTDAIENQIERFAPGFRDCVLARLKMNCADFESYNPNLIGGDIVGGVADWRQLITRPVARLKPHTTPNSKIFICSASTPPGGGVHGMGGYWAAQEVLSG
ncbi:MAG: NAD(P)/FAD-dependent oxidoreductase [Verrucomicrobiales bacterium]|nr:NAD(P)/FAD-dependent oxidoreductase [Verrucomicrobiales bacterium]